LFQTDSEYSYFGYFWARKKHKYRSAKEKMHHSFSLRRGIKSLKKVWLLFFLACPSVLKELTLKTNINQQQKCKFTNIPKENSEFGSNFGDFLGCKH